MQVVLNYLSILPSSLLVPFQVQRCTRQLQEQHLGLTTTIALVALVQLVLRLLCFGRWATLGQARATLVLLLRFTSVLATQPLLQDSLPPPYLV